MYWDKMKEDITAIRKSSALNGLKRYGVIMKVDEFGDANYYLGMKSAIPSLCKCAFGFTIEEIDGFIPVKTNNAAYYINQIK